MVIPIPDEHMYTHKQGTNNNRLVGCARGQIHESIIRLIKEQIRHRLILFEGETMQSIVKSITKK